MNKVKVDICEVCGSENLEEVLNLGDSKHNSIQAFFDRSSSNKILFEFGKPDLITFTNVFAHIENLPELIENLKSLTLPCIYGLSKNNEPILIEIEQINIT